MKRFLKRIIPGRIILLYHGAVSFLGAYWYGFPSRSMIVIGVTGTKGKTSTANFIWAVLARGGYKTGIITTANIRIGEAEAMNEYHMTMPGRAAIHRLMARMLREGCGVAVVETTSEGIKQYRHAGIAYDILVFTNLTPEHLESHGGSFEEYKRTKGEIFGLLATSKKEFNGKRVEKVIVANRDSEHADYFLGFPADKKITFGFSDVSDIRAEDPEDLPDGVAFNAGGFRYSLRILGQFNIQNALPAIAVGRLLGIPDSAIQEGLLSLSKIPGRMEEIFEGQQFRVFVDYAHEEKSITYVLETARTMCGDAGRIGILLGAEGGGRDKAKRPIMGKLAARLADYVVVTNVDPYEDDPRAILEDIAQSAERFGKIRGKDLFVIEDRRAGIQKILSFAKKGDVVLVTGKGAEQSIVIGGVRYPWDDRARVKEELRKLAVNPIIMRL